MVNTVWLIKRPADFPEIEMLEEEDYIILIQDAVLRTPSGEKNWAACKEDAEARNIKIPEDKLLSYDDIIDIIEKANKVIVW
ncbi:MAG: sulfurtransferase TusB [Aquificota bacterium]|nr:MAG: sulfurtransferase TusB [Aquificota bacterium]